MYCRKDGTRLLQGKQCFGCGAPAEPEDQFCWQCGLKSGEKPPPPPPPLSYEERQAENDRRIEAIKELARKKGLLKETVV
jgi:predicted amidophosphoribosyltransferase